jgi:PPM family protein phosphatase
MKIQIQNGTITWHEIEIEYAACTDSGRVRKSNEDAYLAFPDEALFCVADGAGGHANGAMASSSTLDAVKFFLSRDSFSEDTTAPIDGEEEQQKNETDNSVSEAAQYANSIIFGENGHRNMASTLVCCHLQHSSAHITHIGDSRCYLYRDKALKQMTEDHSLVWQLYRNGSINEEEIHNHPRRNIITRAIGIEKEIKTDYSHIKFRPGDVFLLCSDGLSSMLSDRVIATILEKNSVPLSDIIENLVEQANNAGGKDNITVILLKILCGKIESSHTDFMGI